MIFDFPKIIPTRFYYPSDKSGENLEPIAKNIYIFYKHLTVVSSSDCML
jgi:hypothetical protein